MPLLDLTKLTPTQVNTPGLSVADISWNLFTFYLECDFSDSLSICDFLLQVFSSLYF